MAVVDVQEYLKLVPALRRSPTGRLWLSYDAEADVLYVNFKGPSCATDSEITDDDVIIRYEGEEIVGVTVLHASKRQVGCVPGRCITPWRERNMPGLHPYDILLEQCSRYSS